MHVDTVLGNANLYKELLMHSNVVEFGLTFKEEKMCNNILTRLKKCSSTVDTPNSSSAPSKKPRNDQIASPIKILPPSSKDRNMVDRVSSKDSATFAPVRTC